MCHRPCDTSARLHFLFADIHTWRDKVPCVQGKLMGRCQELTGQSQGFRITRATSKTWNPAMWLKELSLPEKNSMCTLTGLGHTWRLHTRQLFGRRQVTRTQKYKQTSCLSRGTFLKRKESHLLQTPSPHANTRTRRQLVPLVHLSLFLLFKANQRAEMQEIGT